MTPIRGPSNAASTPSSVFGRGRSDAAANGKKPLSEGKTGDEGDPTLLTGGYRNTSIEAPPAGGCRSALSTLPTVGGVGTNISKQEGDHRGAGKLPRSTSGTSDHLETPQFATSRRDFVGYVMLAGGGVDFINDLPFAAGRTVANRPTLTSSEGDASDVPPHADGRRDAAWRLSDVSGRVGAASGFTLACGYSGANELPPAGVIVVVGDER